MRKPHVFPRLRRLHIQSDGSFLVTALVLTMVLTAIGVSIAEFTTVQYQHTTRQIFVENARLVAEAGVEQSVRQLNVDDTFAGFGTTQTFFDNTTQGLGTFTTTITDNGDHNGKTILSTGKVYRPNNHSSPYITRKVKVSVVGTSSTGYSVFSGPGGLILNGVAAIVNSDVYTNGGIKMTGAAQIGTLLTPVNVDVANRQCPTGSNPGSTYPSVCTDGTQPLSLGGLSHIWGHVCATGQTSTSGITSLEAGCTAPVVSMPTYDRQAQIDAVTTTGTGASNSYGCSGGILGIGTSANWPAKLKITGNVTIGGTCNVTVNGNVYITGNLSIGATSHIKVADSVGTTRPVIIVDGTITVNGAASMSANSSGTTIQFISFKNSTGNPAANVTGTDLYNSSKQETVSLGGASILPGMIFQSYWGKITVGGVNMIGSVLGQTVDMSGSATVTFGTSLASGAKTWTIRSYQQVYE